jgi:ribosomal-protein-alanine N-acetyltransferase
MMAVAGELTVEIRQLQRMDEAHTCAAFMSSSEPWVTLRRSYEDSIKMLVDPGREVYVAAVGQETVGFMILQMRGAFIGYIQTVGILPAWRNRGIGSQLIQFAEDRIFRETPNAFICASSFNPRVQRLYERLGYEVVGELKEYIVPGHSEILLRKSIAPLTEFGRGVATIDGGLENL